MVSHPPKKFREIKKNKGPLKVLQMLKGMLLVINVWGKDAGVCGEEGGVRGEDLRPNLHGDKM